MKKYPQKLEQHKQEFFDISLVNSTNHATNAYLHKSFPLFMHSHSFYEMNIVLQGEGRHYIEDKNYPSQKGDIFIIPPKLSHGYYALDDKLTIFHLIIDERIFTEYYNSFKNFPERMLLLNIEPQLRSANSTFNFFLRLSEKQFNEFYPKFINLINLSKIHSPETQIVFDLYTVGLICELSLLLSSKLKRTSDKKKTTSLSIVNTVQYMNERYDAHITLDDLAHIALCSKTSYVKQFQQFFGDSPINYLIKLRINHAKEMLLHTKHSIAFIAQSCGFFDSSHFIYYFKKTTGCTPLNYRETMKLKQQKNYKQTPASDIQLKE